MVRILGYFKDNEMYVNICNCNYKCDALNNLKINTMFYSLSLNSLKLPNVFFIFNISELNKKYKSFISHITVRNNASIKND